MGTPQYVLRIWEKQNSPDSWSSTIVRLFLYDLTLTQSELATLFSKGFSVTTEVCAFGNYWYSIKMRLSCSIAIVFSLYLLVIWTAFFSRQFEFWFALLVLVIGFTFFLSEFDVFDLLLYYQKHTVSYIGLCSKMIIKIE